MRAITSGVAATATKHQLPEPSCPLNLPENDKAGWDKAREELEVSGLPYAVTITKAAATPMHALATAPSLCRSYCSSVVGLKRHANALSCATGDAIPRPC